MDIKKNISKLCLIEVNSKSSEVKRSMPWWDSWEHTQHSDYFVCTVLLCMCIAYNFLRNYRFMVEKCLTLHVCLWLCATLMYIKPDLN